MGIQWRDPITQGKYPYVIDIDGGAKITVDNGDMEVGNVSGKKYAYNTDFGE